jgi:K+-sensing histidine kinase KdpD
MDFSFAARDHRSAVLVVAVVLPVAICAVLSGFRDSVTAAAAALVLVLVVVGAAATGDRVAGILAALSGGAAYDFFLTQPYHRFTIADADDVEVTVLLALIGVAVTELALWGHRQQSRSGRRAGYLEGALRTAEVVAARDESPDAMIDLVCREIVEVLGISRCRFVRGPVHDSRLAILDHDGAVTRGGRVVQVERRGLPSNEETALLVVQGEETVGHFILTAAGDIAYPSLEQRRVAVLLADQVASGLGSRSE